MSTDREIDNGEIAKLEEVIDARPIQLVPLHCKRVVYGNREFKLRKMITIDTDFQNGLWIHEHLPLRIYAWGRTRAESLDAFRQDFACLWDELGMDDDECLTEDALELKHIIRSLVDEDASTLTTADPVRLRRWLRQ